MCKEGSKRRWYRGHTVRRRSVLLWIVSTRSPSHSLCQDTSSTFCQCHFLVNLKQSRKYGGSGSDYVCRTAWSPGPRYGVVALARVYSPCMSSSSAGRTPQLICHLNGVFPWDSSLCDPHAGGLMALYHRTKGSVIGRDRWRCVRGILSYLLSKS
jgi:hypothetical protein